MNCTIGIDVGTSGCKAVLVDESTDIVASATRGYELIMPRPGWTEQRPEDWWNAAVECLKELSGALGGRRLAGIGLSGQMHGMVALDMDGRPVRPAILWNDQRTQTQCDEIVAAAGGLDALLAYTSNPMLTGFTAGKILWLKQNEPEHYAKTRRIVNPKDYIRLRLCGTLATDESDASGFGLFDVKERRWAYELIRKAGLDTDMFPDVAESVAVTGEVRASAAAATGIPAGTPVFGGGGDAVISTVGMGLALPGRVGVTLGTSGVVATGLERYRANPGGRLQLCCNVLPGAWHIFGCTLNAAGSYQWFKNALGDMETFLAPQTGEDAYAALDYAAQQVAPGADGLLFLPYLNGERCPHNDPRAKGAFVGLSLAHGKGHFARAVLEGVAFSLREVFELVAPGGAEEIVLAGGGAKSGLWRAIIADVFGLPAVTVYGSEEGGAYGAALVAGANPAMWGDLVRAMSLVRQKSRTLPEDGHTALYQERYAAYKRLYPALRDAGV